MSSITESPLTPTPETAQVAAPSQPSPNVPVPSPPVAFPPPSLLNVKQQGKKRLRAEDRAIKLRGELWPTLDVTTLWHRKKNDGFTTMPRTMPLIMNIINDLSKGVATESAPAGKAYFSLWCRIFDSAMVIVDNESDLAVESGYSGERNITTWRKHMTILKDLGFIDAREGGRGPFEFVLVFNPYVVIKNLRNRIQDKTYMTLYRRAMEIGAELD